MMVYIYNAHPVTREYLPSQLPVEADLDPMERNPVIPALASLEKPSEVKDNEVNVLEGRKWKVVPDFRGTKYWLSYDEEIVIKQIGETVPEGAFLTRPDEPISNIKERKIASLSNSVSDKIQSGFESNALGSLHVYPSKEIDQLNLAGLVAINIDAPYVCEDENGVWNKRLHTAEQLKQAAIDGALWKSALSDEFRARRDAVENATTVSEIEAISEVY